MSECCTAERRTLEPDGKTSPTKPVFTMAPPPSNEATAETSCCPSPAPSPEARGGRIPGYRAWPFLEGWVESLAGSVPQVATALDWGDRLGRWQMRWGLGRDRYRIAPYTGSLPANTLGWRAQRTPMVAVAWPSSSNPPS